MKIAGSTRRINDVAGKPTIFEQTPVEPKKKSFNTKTKIFHFYYWNQKKQHLHFQAPAILQVRGE